MASILQATVALAEKEGFKRLTTPRIAAKAGVSIGSLYQYFSDREAIYSALYDATSTECAVEVRANMMKMVNESPERGMLAMVSGLLAVYEHNALILLRLVNDVPGMRERTMMLSSFESLVRASIKLYVKLHLAKGSESKMETQLFLMESGVVHAIQRYALERPPLVLREKLLKDLSNTVLYYLNEEVRISGGRVKSTRATKP
ncbi:MAG: transcriptional regulator, TetR family [Hydrocarboniphaga sp.]|uniref:TetR/AcrR family transcriptional regulator n=1 Tax=Hydrocarboniphaga sp. TaxID=2033016 RepID=UPI00263850D7|nr:TetR/AcrR family transcriptional regulator [Hydrocarboniphaga sp.]MDB5968369.1 transcriptional regulator, TetR family [Hydrocarboniphaga sp.]